MDNSIQKLKLQRDGLAIQNITNPSKELQLIAVKENGFAIEYIKDPSEEVQLAAVKENGFAIKYIKDPSEKVQLASLWDPTAREFVVVGLELPTIHYIWIHDKISSDVNYFKKNLNKIKKYSDIKFIY